MTLLEQAEDRFGLREQPVTTVMETTAGDGKVPLPIAGLEISKKVLALQQTGNVVYDPKDSQMQHFAKFAADRLSEKEAETAYRVFRAYIMVFFTPEELSSMGVTP